MALKKPEFYQDKSGEWRWRIESNNGEIVASSSEGFDSKQGAVKNLAVLRGSGGVVIGDKKDRKLVDETVRKEIDVE